MARTGEVARKTAETEIALRLEIDGTGAAKIDTGVGFLNHMLTLLSKHGLMDLDVCCKGDLEVDAHHTVEDIGLCLGQALRQAAGDKRGIARDGTFYVPMDEALVRVALDFSGRPFFVLRGELPYALLGQMDTQLVAEFFRAVAMEAGLTLHIDILAGENAHHMVEGAFKAFGRALRAALTLDAREQGIPSTKGSL